VSGERREDERLALGVFAQDLAQELPMELPALEYVVETVRDMHIYPSILICIYTDIHTV